MKTTITVKDLKEIIKNIPDDFGIYVDARKDEAGDFGVISVKGLYIERKETVGRNDIVLYARDFNHYENEREVCGGQEKYKMNTEGKLEPVKKFN